MERLNRIRVARILAIPLRVVQGRWCLPAIKSPTMMGEVGV